MSGFEHITFTKQGAVATIELNRPDDANGLDARMSEELNRAARLCDADPGLKAVILTARGRFFCAGGDINEMLAQGEDVRPGIKALADNLHGAISTLCRMDAALIVAVNGIAAGAGFSLALIGDIVVAAESAVFTMAYTKSGLCPDGSSTYFLPRLVGLRKAQELMLLNTKLDAGEALEIGLVTRVVADDELMTDARRLADDFAAGARLSTAFVKKLLLASFDNSLETQMELEGRCISLCVASPDGREGIQAFVDKRKPEFD